MKLVEKTSPREFSVGINNKIVIKDCGSIILEPDEQVTFITKNGKEYDVVRKDWGFYATPSVNGRLKKFGFKTALVKNVNNQYFIMLVEKEKVGTFLNYIELEKHEIVVWLDEN